MGASDAELLHVTVDVWHPGCWTLRTTEEADAGLLGHGMSAMGAGVAEQFSVYGVYGGSRDAVEALVAAVRESDLTERVTALAAPARGATAAGAPAMRDIVVEFDPAPSIRSAFTDRGFLHYGPTRHEGGRERRTLLVRAERDAVRRALDDIEAAYEAEIDLARIAAAAPDGGAPPSDRLSPRQREAFRVARARGYYEYPRAATARELAGELGITKTTFLEHLRKAEAKLLGAVDLD